MPMLTAYAITDRAPHRPGLEAIACAEGIVLCAEERAAAPEVSIEAVREHDRVVRAIADEVAAILPMRFGVRGTRAELVDRIARRALAVREGLAAVQGAVQVTIRVAGDVVEEDEEDARALGPGTRWLRERSRARTPRIRGWDRALGEARAIARAEKIERGDPRIEKVRAYHLVARGDLVPWMEAAKRAAAPGWEIAIGAPSPPYAFVPEDLA